MMNVYNPFKTVTEDPNMRFHWCADKQTTPKSASGDHDDNDATLDKRGLSALLLPFVLQEDALTPVRSNSKRELTPEQRKRVRAAVHLDGAATSEAVEKDEEEDILPPPPPPQIPAAKDVDCAGTPGSRSTGSKLSSASTAPLSDKSLEEIIVAAEDTPGPAEDDEEPVHKRRASRSSRRRSSHSKSHKQKHRSSMKKSKSSKQKKGRKHHRNSSPSKHGSRHRRRDEEGGRSRKSSSRRLSIQNTVSLTKVYQSESKAPNTSELLAISKPLRSVYHDEETRGKLLKSVVRARSRSCEPLSPSAKQRQRDQLFGSNSSSRRPSDFVRRHLESQQAKAKREQRRVTENKSSWADEAADEDSDAGAPSLGSYLEEEKKKSNRVSIRRSTSGSYNSAPRMAVYESDDDDDMFSLFSWSQSETSARLSLFRRRGSLGSLEESIRSFHSYGTGSCSLTVGSHRTLPSVQHSMPELTEAEQERRDALLRRKSRRMTKELASMGNLVNALEPKEQRPKTEKDAGVRRRVRSNSVSGIEPRRRSTQGEERKGRRASTSTGRSSRRSKEGKMDRSGRGSVTSESKGTATKLKMMRRRRRHSTSELGQ